MLASAIFYSIIAFALGCKAATVIEDAKSDR
jgi:hypothetical protein